MPRTLSLHLALTLALLLLTTNAAAQDNSLTLYSGGRFGGSFEQDDPTSTTTPPATVTARLRDGSAFSLALDHGIDAQRQLQFFLSRHNTGLRLAQGGTLPLRVLMLHVGGTNFFNDTDGKRFGRIGEGPYAVGGLGVSRMDPGLDGFFAETRPSMNLGFGWMYPLGSTLALRLEARGYLTLIKGSGSLFCSGGCTLKVSGDTLTQGELLIGLTARF